MLNRHILPALTTLFILQTMLASAQTPVPAAAQHPTPTTTQTPIIRKQLMLAHFDTRPISKVDIREIDLAPGQKGPLHKHPCPVVGYIVSGTIYFQLKGDSAIILKAGSPFFEPADVIVTHFDNASTTAPAKFVLNYLMNTEKEFIILLADSTSR